MKRFNKPPSRSSGHVARNASSANVHTVRGVGHEVREVVSTGNSLPAVASARHPFGRFRIWELLGLANLLMILGLAAALRLYRLDEVPAGLYSDEVAMSVEARCLGQTLRDMDGTLLPLFPTAQFSAAWGYKGMIYQPIYVYSKIAFEFLLPQGAASVRLPSVIWGICGIASSALLSWYATASLRRWSRWVAMLSTALLLTISPWHHHFSRLGFEVISCPVFVTTGAIFMLRAYHDIITTSCRGTGIRRRTWWTLIVGVFVTTLAAYAYHTARMFAPMLVVAMASMCMWACQQHEHRRTVALLCISTMCVTLLPLLAHESWRMLGAAAETSEWFKRNFIFTSNFDYMKRIAPGLQRLAKVCTENQTCWADMVLSRQPVAGLYLLVYNYLSYLSPSFLFYCKDVNRRHSLSGSGVLLPSESVLLLLGLALTVRRAVGRWSRDEEPLSGETRAGRLYSRFLLLWLLLWPIPASLCVQTPHAIRSFVGLPVFELIMAYGLALHVETVLSACQPAATATTAAESSTEHKATPGRSKATGGRSRWLYAVYNPDRHWAVLAFALVCILSFLWIASGAVSYQQRYFSDYAGESVENFNREASIQSFLDLKDMNYFNKTRVLVSQGVDNSFVYMLYAETVRCRCLHVGSAGSGLNEKLRACNTPYVIVFNNVSAQHTLGAGDLLLMDIRTLRQYPDDAQQRMQLVRHWHNLHGAVQLRIPAPTAADTVDDDDDEF